MPVTRLRMRPWLEKQIASKTIPGLLWLDEEEMIFQIPWKHAARHGWNIDKDACLFRSWAIHTGKFKLGEKEPDPKTWKANFRCAMNSLPDIKEVKDKSVYKGSSAVRVYRMLPAQVKLEKKERKSKASKDSKNRTKNKADGSFSEVEEAVKHCQQPDDHSNYTARLFSTQDIDVGSTEIIATMSECEVSSSLSDLNNTMDIPMPDSTSDMYPFQVSPMASGSEEDEEVMNDEELLKMFEPITEWQQINVDGKGYYTNELAAPGTFLHDLSSVLEDMSSVSGDIEVRVTTDMRPAMESIWHELPPISCTL